MKIAFLVIFFCITVGSVFGYYNSEYTYIERCVANFEEQGFSEAYGYSYFGDQYSRIGEYKSALKCYDKAVQLMLGKKNQELYLCARAYAYQDLLDYERAKQDFDAAISINPDACFYVSRGGVYLMEGNFDRALGDYKFAIKANPELWKETCTKEIKRCRGITENSKMELISKL